MSTYRWRQLFVGLLTWLGASVSAQAQAPLGFYTITPCRIFDSRDGHGPLQGDAEVWIGVGAHCGLPADAVSAALNFTAVGANAPASLSAYPPGVVPPGTIVVAFNTGVTRASNAIIKLGAAGGPIGGEGKMALRLSPPMANETHYVVDVSGYFRPQLPTQQWRSWEQVLLSTIDYTTGGANPHADVELEVRFTRTSTNDAFVQGAFWGGDLANPRAFKVRSALPAGNWTWQIESCLRNGVSCLADGWSPLSGTIVVQSNLSTGNPLYDRGFPIQTEVIEGGETTITSELVYPDGTAFNWIADTAWAAPPREYDPNPDPEVNAAQVQPPMWPAFVENRGRGAAGGPPGRGFTGVLVAPAITWAADGTDPWPSLPSALGFSFTGCSGAIPRTCSTYPLAYWEHFRQMVGKANEQGMVVGIMGVMNPIGIGTQGTYPDAAGAKQFARWLAAFLQDCAVIYSPSFDDHWSQHGSTPGRCALIRHTGVQLQKTLRGLSGVARKGIRAVHLAGGVTSCEDYRSVATGTNCTAGGPSAKWLNYYFFQSGHGGGNSTVGTCPGGITGDSDLENAMRRAYEMPKQLISYATPKHPAINAEGPYDSADFEPNPHPGIDERLRIRHAGYNSTLSGASGFAYGAHRLSYWWNPTSAHFDIPSADDMSVMNAHVLNQGLQQKFDLILNQPAGQEFKRVLAGVGTEKLVGYLPGRVDANTVEPPNSITIKTGGYADLTCASANWTVKWFNPVTGAIEDPPTQVCTPGGTVANPNITLQHPGCLVALPDNPQCDWILEIERTEQGGKGELEAAVAPVLDVWVDTSERRRTSAIRARVRGSDNAPQGVILSGAGRHFQRAPRVGSLGADLFVVWQADGLDGSLEGVFGALVTPAGELRSGPFKVNDHTEHDQRDPSVAGGRDGAALVVWSSFGQDGDRGGIYGRLVTQDVDTPLRQEFQLSEMTAGHQQEPQVVAFPGGYWVAWETADADGQITSLSLRHILRDGRPLGREMRIQAPLGEQVRLLDLGDSSPSSVRLGWWRQDKHGNLLGRASQTARPSGLANTPTLTGGS